MIDRLDLLAIEEHTLKSFKDQPSRARLPGMVVDLSPKEQLQLAYVNGVLMVLHGKGIIDLETFDKLMPKQVQSTNFSVNED